MTDLHEIVIVSGLPRSGTSLMMQMLASGGIEPLTDQLRQADTDNPRGYFEFERVKKIKDDKSWLPEARGKAVKMISQLLYDLPNTETYKVIFMRREIDEIVISQEKMLTRRGVALPDRDAIKSAFAAHLNKLFEWLGQRPWIELIEIHYNELIANPEGPMQQIAAFVSQDLNRQNMLNAIDPALHRNREGTQIQG